MFIQFIKYSLSLILIGSFFCCTEDKAYDSLGYPKELPSQDTAEAGSLIWSDEFDGSGAPIDTNWAYDIGHGSNGWGNSEIQYYTDKSKNVRIEDGKLVIEAKKEDGQWTSARIKTQGKQTFKHVTVKARAKLPKGSGTWPAIWMLGSDVTDEGWPACGEIDIMEHVGKNPGSVHSSLHTPSSHGNTQNTGGTEITNFHEEFHVYETNWTSERIVFKVDGNTFYTYDPAQKNSQTWPFDDRFFIIMNIAMGGNWEVIRNTNRVG